MNNLRFLKGVIIILIMLNLVALAFLWFGRPKHRPGPFIGKASEYLIRELRLTPLQQDKYIKLRDNHREQLDILQERDRKFHDRFFETIFLSAPDKTEIQQLADSIAGTRKEIELLMFGHFRDLQQLLNGDQKIKFHRIFRDAFIRMMSPPPPPPMRNEQ